jgi:hypothetical protein
MRVLNGFACGANVSGLFYTTLLRDALGKHQDPLLLLLMLSAILLNGYYAFRPVKGAEDDSGEGCQSERGHSEAGRE